MLNLYVYGIARTGKKKDFGQVGHFGKEVKAIDADELAAIVSVYDQEIDLSKENLLTHMKVLDAVLAEGVDVLPLKFGTVAQNEEEIKRLLKSGAPHWKSLIERIAGKVELNLQIFWPDFDEKVRQMVEEDKSVAELRDQMLNQLSYRAQITAGELFKNIVEDKKKKEASEISNKLIPISESVKENPYLTDTNVANLSFLVKRGKEKEFDKAVKKIVEEKGDKYLIKYYGPSAPFNFI